MKKLWALGAAVIVVCVVVGLVVWRHIASGVAAGTVIEVDELGTTTTERVQVEVPNAAYSVEVTQPLSSLPPHAIASSIGLQHDAEDGISGGGRFVGLDLDRIDRSALPTTVAAVSGTTPTTLVLVADGRRIDLPTATDLAVPDQAVYVALPSDPKSLDLDVTVEGTTQHLDLLHVGTADHGAASAYYDAAALLRSATDAAQCLRARVSLSAGQFDPGPDSGAIHFEVPQPIVAVPYVAGLGWAAAGRVWLVVPITTRFDQGTFVTWPRFGAPGEVLYLPTLQRTTVRVDGRTPGSSVAFYAGSTADLARSNQSGAYYVFNVAGSTHTLQFSQVYADRLHRNDRPAPAGAPERITGRVSCSFAIS
ncbi:hypothetical protein [Nocardioides ultimimeridianus]